MFFHNNSISNNLIYGYPIDNSLWDSLYFKFNNMIYVIITIILLVGLLLSQARRVAKDTVYQDLKEKEQNELLQIVFSAIEVLFGIKANDPKLRDSKDVFYLDLRKIIFHNLYPNYGTLTEVGKVFGKNHATVINAIRRYAEHYNTDKYFKQKADAVESIIKEKLNEKS